SRLANWPSGFVLTFTVRTKLILLFPRKCLEDALGLLTSSPQGDFDPTADVVTNFLRWIPRQDSLRRGLVLDVALFSRPFNQDDMTALKYFPADIDQQSTLYQWLVGLPFVRSNFQDGRYRYH